ncbi:MAG: hypothetical protein MZV70_18245 [Desulfobacterales bacterium]|nr:hypothetical protein [Desulfobacterales bacterium]
MGLMQLMPATAGAVRRRQRLRPGPEHRGRRPLPPGPGQALQRADQASSSPPTTPGRRRSGSTRASRPIRRRRPTSPGIMKSYKKPTGLGQEPRLTWSRTPTGRTILVNDPEAVKKK